MNIPLIRLLNQQISSQQFDKPEKVVEWMGAIQAQDPKAAQWAVGLRTRKSTKTIVSDALRQGKIIRIHVMRPTWHFVASQDVRWLLRLTRDNNERVYSSYLKSTGVTITERDYKRSADMLRFVLQGGKQLNVSQLSDAFHGSGLPDDERHIKGYLWRGESREVVCGGDIIDGKVTFRLLDELVHADDATNREEALATLATKYFRSHSPATEQDFIWWTGLSAADARRAISLISQDLHTVLVGDRKLLVHTDCRTRGRLADNVTLLPPYDEYMLGYKDRTDVLPKELQHLAFNSRGIFQRILVQSGQVVANWNEKRTANGVNIGFSYFRQSPAANELAIAKAVERYIQFNK